MPTQKTFKRTVRARITKTGESYTAARRQILDKSDSAPGAVPDLNHSAPGELEPSTR